MVIIAGRELGGMASYLAPRVWCTLVCGEWLDAWTRVVVGRTPQARIGAGSEGMPPMKLYSCPKQWVSVNRNVSPLRSSSAMIPCGQRFVLAARTAKVMTARLSLPHQ